MKEHKRSRKQRLVAILALILALLMILPMVITVLSNIGSAASVTAIRGEIDTLKDKNKKLAGERTALKAQLKSIQSDKAKAIEKKNNLERQIAILHEEIENMDFQIAQYDELIASKELQVKTIQEKEEAQFRLFCQQVRAMEKGGTASYLSILFSATSFSDLLDRVNLVNSIENYNAMVRRQLQETRAALEQAKAELEAAKAELEAAKAEREEMERELIAQEQEVEALIQEIKKDEQDAQKALDDLEADARAMDAAIAKKEKELQAAIEEARRLEEERLKKNGKIVVSGDAVVDSSTGYCWPLPKQRVSVTSFFGNRKDPFTGKSANHSGTDIGAYAGTSIYAAHTGVVIASEYHSSYGNYVVISKGDGISTLYAHMNKRAVKVGDVVTIGQVIGYVGSTGRSTAPHLHLEFRLNGVRQDALKYYPNIKWTNNTGFQYK